MPAHIAIDREKLAEVCRRRGVSKLSLFGSVIRDDFADLSDVGVLVEYAPGRGRTLSDFGGNRQRFAGAVRP